MSFGKVIPGQQTFKAVVLKLGVWYPGGPSAGQFSNFYGSTSKPIRSGFAGVFDDTFEPPMWGGGGG